MKVLHVLAELDRSGAERMLACSFDRWTAAGIESVVLGMAEGEHPFAPTLAAAGYEVVLAPSLRSAQGLSALRRAVTATKPQLVHVHSESCFDAATLVASLSRGVSGIVRTVHNNFRFSGFLRTRRAFRIAATRPLSVVWVACSPEVAETERAYLSREIHVIENWIDVDEVVLGATPAMGADLRGELDIASDARVLVVVGNCGAAKNHELLASALDQVELPVHVLHIGRRHAEGTAERAAWSRVPSRHTVHHLGGRDDVPRLLAASDLFVLPSLYEGLPLAAIEALCARLPVLASRAPGLHWLEAVPGAELVPFDPTAWGAAISGRLSRGFDRTAADEAASVARSRFGARRGVAEYLRVYELALTKRRHPFGFGRVASTTGVRA